MHEADFLVAIIFTVTTVLGNRNFECTIFFTVVVNNTQNGKKLEVFVLVLFVFAV